MDATSIRKGSFIKHKGDLWQVLTARCEKRNDIGLQRRCPGLPANIHQGAHKDTGRQRHGEQE